MTERKTMSFNELKSEELVKVAEFFVVDVEANKPEKPTKKELLAALAAGEKPVTWDDYEKIYLPAQGTVEPPVPQDESTATGDENLGEAFKVTEEEKGAVRQLAEEKKVLIKMERANPRFDIRGHTFTKSHPFALMSEKDALYVVQNVEGFRMAMPSEAADYYG